MQVVHIRSSPRSVAAGQDQQLVSDTDCCFPHFARASDTVIIDHFFNIFVTILAFRPDVRQDSILDPGLCQSRRRHPLGHSLCTLSRLL
jgi:hypothetical protein